MSIGEHKTLIFVSAKSLDPLGSRLFPLYHRNALHVPFDRQTILIRGIMDCTKLLRSGSPTSESASAFIIKGWSAFSILPSVKLDLSSAQ